jgi:hypothetical protein
MRPECDDQLPRLQRDCADKGCEKKQRQFECHFIHVPAPQKSERRLNEIASDGEAATSPRSGNAGMAVRANSIVKPACMAALLTVAAIRKKIRRQTFFARA